MASIGNKKKMMDYYSDDVISLASLAKAICHLSYVLNESADVKIQEFFCAAPPNTMPCPFIMLSPSPHDCESNTWRWYITESNDNTILCNYYKII